MYELEQPSLKSKFTETVPGCPDCLVAVRDEPLESNVTCHSSYATRANITVGGKNASAHMFTAGGFRSLYIVKEEDHETDVTCSVGNDDVETVLTTTKTLYVAGTLILCTETNARGLLLIDRLCISCSV